MIWQDILLNSKPADDQITSSLAQLFGVSTKEVVIVDDVTEQIDIGDPAILCERSAVEGDFVLQVTIMPRKPAVIAIADSKDDKELVRTLGESLRADCLIGDDSENPYAYILIPAGGTAEYVYLNAEEPEEDRYVIDKRQ